MAQRRLVRFTLFEVVIAMLLISLLGGVFSLGIKDVIGTYRFNRNVSELREALQATRRFAIARNTDMEVFITLTAQGCVFQRWTDADCLPKERSFACATKTYSGISGMHLNGAARNAVHLVFSPSGSSEKTLTFFYKNYSQRVFVS